MAPILGRIAARADYMSASEAPIYVLIVPVSVAIVLAACVALRRMVRRREAKRGAQAIEAWPWSWLSACVGSGSLHKSSPYADDWDAATQPPPPPPMAPAATAATSRHMSFAGSASSPLGSRFGSIGQHPGGQRRPTQMWEYVGRLDAEREGGGRWSKESSLASAKYHDDDGDDDDEQALVGSKWPTYGEGMPTTPKPAMMTRGDSPRLTKQHRRTEAENGDGVVSPISPGDSDLQNGKGKGLFLTQPARLHLPAGVSRSESHWVLGTRR